MPKFPLTLVAVSGVFLAIATGTVAQTTAPPNVPVAVICYSEQNQSWRFGYLNRIDQNGDAQYSSADGKLGATISAKGVVLPPANRPAAMDCYGKTVDELRANGRVMDFQRAR
ncbi:MAG TPA: hypothetical protein VK512_09270 [Xanthobacteraceae bacterium]|nr:hypothetical protein [Xanthobacteraceae bacterium]